MKVRTWSWAVAVAVFAFTAAGAETPGVCTKANGKKVQCVDFRPRATPTPTPTATPKPTLAPDCSDGSFGKLPGGFLEMKERFYEPGRLYNLCMTVAEPPLAPSKNMTLNSANASDGSCDIYEVWVTSPSGVSHSTSGPSIALGPRFESGRWSVLLWLNPNLGPLCGGGKRGIAMWASWF